MTQFWKRSLALLLAFSLVIGYVPAPAFAEEVEEVEEYSEDVVYEEEPGEDWFEDEPAEPEEEEIIEEIPEEVEEEPVQEPQTPVFEEITDSEDAVNAEAEEFEEITDSEEALLAGTGTAEDPYIIRMKDGTMTNQQLRDALYALYAKKPESFALGGLGWGNDYRYSTTNDSASATSVYNGGLTMNSNAEIESGKTYYVWICTSAGHKKAVYGEQKFVKTVSYNELTANIVKADGTAFADGSVTVTVGDATTTLTTANPTMEVDTGSVVSFSAPNVTGYQTPVITGAASPVTGSYTVTVTYTPNVTHNYTVSENTDEGGTVTLNSAAEDTTVTVGDGDAVTVTVVPATFDDRKYSVSEVKVGETVLTDTDGGDNFVASFNASGSATVSVSYARADIHFGSEKNTTIEWNGYYQDGTKLSTEQVAALKEEIFNKLDVESLPAGATKDNVTIQYYPWYTTKTQGNGYSDANGLTALNAARSDFSVNIPFVGDVGYVFDEFGQRGYNDGAEFTDTNEKVRITYNGLWVDTEITLTEERDPATINYTAPTGQEVDNLEDVVDLLQADGVLSVQGYSDDEVSIAYKSGTLSNVGGNNTLTYTASVGNTDDYLAATRDVEITVVLKSYPADITFETAGVGSGTVRLGNETAGYITETGTLTTGTYDLTVEPTDWNEGVYVEKVEFGGTEVTGTYTNGTFTATGISVANDNDYTLKVTYGTNTLTAKAASFEVTGWIGNLGLSYDGRVADYKAGLTLANFLGSEPSVAGTSVVQMDTYDGWKATSEINAWLAAALDVPATKSVRIVWTPENTAKYSVLTSDPVDAIVTDSRPEVTITCDNEGKELSFDLPADLTAANLGITASYVDDDGKTVDLTPSLSGKTFGSESVTAKVDGTADYQGAEKTFTLKLTQNTYEAKWLLNEGDETAFATANYAVGEEIKAPETNPTKTGYTFKSWPDFTEGMTMTNEGATFVADWDINKHTVTWNVDGVETKVEEVNYGTAISTVKPTDPEKEGHTFAGWFDAEGNALADDATMPDTDVTYTADWEINKYTVKWMANGAVFGSQNDDFGAAIVVPEGKPDSYVEGTTNMGFQGWDYNGDGYFTTDDVAPETIPAKDVTYYAIYAPEGNVARIGNVYYATLQNALKAAEDGETVVLLEDVEVTSRLNFNEYVKDGKAVTVDGDGKAIRGNNSSWPTANAKKHLVCVNADNITLKNITLDSNSQAQGVNVYMAQNITFDNVTITNKKGWNADLTVNGSTLTVKNYLYAVYVDVSNGTNVTTDLGIVAEEGAVLEVRTLQIGSAAYPNTDLDKALSTDDTSYYTFKKLDANGELAGYTNSLSRLSNGYGWQLLEGANVTGDVTLLNATHTGSLNLGGFSLTVADGKAITVNGALTVTGGTNVTKLKLGDIAATIAAPEELNVTNGTDTTYSVIYVDGVHRLGSTITIVYGNGTADAVFTVNAGESFEAPADPTWTDHKFEGWDAEIVTTPVGDATYTAKWSADADNDGITDGTDGDPYWTVTIDKQDGTEAAVENNVLNGDQYATPAAIDKANAIFVKWDKVVNETAHTITFTAVWNTNDANDNEVDDNAETVAITVVKANEDDKIAVGCKGKLVDETKGLWLYDSTELEEGKLTITATPVVKSGISSTWVKSVTVDGVAAELAYGANYVATATIPMSNPINPIDEDATTQYPAIVVTFEVAEFTLDEDGELFFYTGIEDPDKEELYRAVIVDPEFSETNVTSVEYLARPAGSYYFPVPEILNYTVPIINYEIKLGGEPIKLELGEAWLEISEYNEIKDQIVTGEELEELLEEEIQAIKDDIAKIDLSGITTFWNALEYYDTYFKPIIARVGNLSNIIQEKGAYLGYHKFGEDYSYTVVDEEGNEITKTAQKDANGNIQETLKAVYTDEAKCISDSTLIATLVDDRKEAAIVGGNLTFEYDEFDDETIMAAISLTDKETGETISGDLRKVKELVGTEVGTETYTVYFDGNHEYKPTSTVFTLTVIQAPSNADVPNLNVTYGEEYDANPVFTNKHGNVINIDSFRFVVGLDVADFDIDGDGVKGLTGRIQLMVPAEYDTILSTIGLSDGKTFTLSELMNILNGASGILGEWGLTEEIMNTLNSVLEPIMNIAESGDLEIVIGGDYPTDIGAYLMGAVSSNPNYETSFDVGYLLIKPDAERVYLDWNYNDTNGIYTPELLKHVNLGASAYAEETFATLNSEATAQINNLFFGLDINGELVAELFNKDITDPEVLENSLDNGAYTQLAFIAEFGNEMYYAVPIVRAFAIIPNTVTVEVVGMNGDHNREILKTFTGGEQGLDVRVTDLNGNVLFDSHYQGEVNNLPEGAELTVIYKGLQTNTQVYDLTQTFRAGEGYQLTKPVHAGAYAVAVTYVEKDAEGKILAVGADAGVIAIQPSQSTITMEEVVIKTFTGEHFNLAETMKIEAKSVNGDENYITDPDYTVISAAIASTDDFTVNGWDAVTGRINIDFPVWMDEIIAKYAPSIQDGITVSELKDKLIAKLPDIAAKMAELGATEEMINSLSNLTGSLSAALDQLPGDVEINFTHDLSVNAVGVYAVMAVVTDSDHYPSADVGVLAIVPDVTQVDLKWNYEDENAIWTRELLRHADLWAKAFNEDGTLNESATLDITYLFVGVDKNGELIVKTASNVDELPNGAYIEAAYIELKVDGEMVISDLIARPVTIVPNMAQVVFVDENGNVNADRHFTYDGAQKAMKAALLVDGAIVEPAEGILTVTYSGVQTNGKVYEVTETAPKHAGAYTVVASYRNYNSEGSTTAIGGALGAMVIEPAKSTISVTGGNVQYDGKEHTAEIIVNEGKLNADYTLFSGHVGVDADIDKLGVEAFTANVHVDMPKWLYDVLSETEAVRDGVNGAYLADFISSYKDELLSKIPVDVLAELGVEQASIDAVIEKLSAYIDQLTTVLAKLPENVGVTFSDNKQIAAYTDPGYYGYYGIVTDSDFYPAADAGLLVIEKLPLTFDLLDTTKTWNGEEQFVEENNPNNADYFAIIANREAQTVNFLLDADLMYLVDKIEQISGVEIPETMDIAELRANEDVQKIIEAVNTLIAEADKLQLPDYARIILDAVKNEMASLPNVGTITINGALPVEVGTYEIYAATYSNYYATEVSEAELEIVPIYVVVDDDADQGKTYGDTDPELTATVSYYSYAGNQMDGVEKVTITELPDSEIGLNYEVTRAQGEDVGEYALSVTASIDESENYVLLAEDIIADNVFTITQAELTITLDNLSKIYGSADPELTYKVETLVNDDTVEDLNLVVTRDAGENVGEYAITATAGNPNYEITIKQPAEFTITPAQITSVELSEKEFVYDGEAHNVTVTVMSGETVVTEYEVSGTFAATNAGEYIVTVDPSDNYIFAEGVSGEVTWTIAKAEITDVELDNTTFTYDANEHEVNVTVKSGETVVAADQYTVAGTLAATDAGTYTVTVTPGDNYVFADGVTGEVTWTIGTKVITAADITLGEALIYNGSEQTQEFTVTDGITYDVTGKTSGTNAGEYTMTVTGTGNYSSSVDVKWTIAKKAVTVTAESFTIVAGQEAPELTAKVEGTVNGETLNYSLSLDPDYVSEIGNHGEYAIVVTPGENPNYDVTVKAGTLKVLECVLTVNGEPFNTWADAEDSIKKDAQIKLYADVEYGVTEDGKKVEQKFIPNGGNIVIDLNGNDLTFHHTATVQYNTVITVTDTSAGEEGTLINTNASYPFVINPKSKLNLTEGVNFDGTMQMNNNNGLSGYFQVDGENIIGDEDSLFITKDAVIRMTLKDDYMTLGITMGGLTLAKDLETLALQNITIGKNTGITIAEGVTLTLQPTTNVVIKGTVDGAGTVAVASAAHLEQILDETTVANVKLADDIENANTTATRAVTIDLNGKTLTGTITGNGDVVVVMDSQVDESEKNYTDAGFVTETTLSGVSLKAGNYYYDVTDLCADGYIAVPGAKDEGVWTVMKGIMTVDNVPYDTWAEAAGDINNGSNQIVLYKDVPVSKNFDFQQGMVHNVELNGNDLLVNDGFARLGTGSTVNITDAKNSGSIVIAEGAKIVVGVNSALKIDSDIALDGELQFYNPNAESGLYIDDQCWIGYNGIFFNGDATVDLTLENGYMDLALTRGPLTLTKDLTTLADQNITILSLSTAAPAKLTIAEGVTLTLDPKTNVEIIQGFAKCTVDGAGTLAVASAEHLQLALDTDVENIKLMDDVKGDFTAPADRAADATVDLNQKVITGDLTGNGKVIVKDSSIPEGSVDPDDYTAAGDITGDVTGATLYAGTYNSDVMELCAEGYVTVPNAKKSGTWTVMPIAASPYVCWNMQTGVYYGDVCEAMNAAKDGETVQMLKDDVTDNELLWSRIGRKLDLNGFKVTADYVIFVNGSDVVDNSASNLGNLNAVYQITLAKDNEQIAVYDEELDGYVFSTYLFQGGNVGLVIDTANDKVTYKFTAYLEWTEGGTYWKYLTDGTDDNRLSIGTRGAWNTEKGVVEDYFIASNDTVIEVVNSNYRRSYEFVLTNISKYLEHGDITITPTMESDTGVVVIGPAVTVPASVVSGN